MYYEVYGSGFPLILLNGFTGSSADLVTLFSDLNDRYKLIIPDLRGHGRSTNPSKEFTFRQAALDIFSLLKHLNITSCHAVGFSGGGCTLLHMAYLQPEVIKSMVIVSATSYFPQQARDIMHLCTIESKMDADWEAMRKIHQYGDEQIQMLWQQAYNFSESFEDMNFTPPMLTQIKAKTLIVQGDRDPIYPIELSLEMYKNIPNTSLWIIPNGGHVPVEGINIQQFKDNIINFLN